MRRRVFIALSVVLAVALMAPAVAWGASEAALRAQLAKLKTQSAQAGREYMNAHWELDETDVRLTKTNKRIAKAKKQLKAANKQLNARANNIYRREDMDMIGFLVGARSYEDFATRMDYLSRIGDADAGAVAEVKRVRASLLAEKKRLISQRKSRAKEVSKLRKQRDALQKRLASTETQFRKVQRELDAKRSGGALPSGVSGAPGPNGMVFPVRGSNYYSDTWGASRSGGRRRHQGTDIMARTGVPVVACVSGSVQARSNGLGGRTIWLRGDNGWHYYYAHLNTWIVRSGRVRAGQVIATVGSTGNASASAPHLHFQMHWHGGAPRNPYPYLRRME